MKAFIFALLLFLLVSQSVSTLADAGDLAVIVNKSNSLNQVSHRALVRIFRLEKQYWENGERIYLILQEAGSREKEIALKTIYRMKEDELKKFWLTKMFRGEIATFPKTLGSNEAVKRFVREVPNAIGIIDASSVDKRVKILSIDGKRPGQAGYPLNE